MKRLCSSVNLPVALLCSMPVLSSTPMLCEENQLLSSSGIHTLATTSPGEGCLPSRLLRPKQSHQEGKARAQCISFISMAVIDRVWLQLHCLN